MQFLVNWCRTFKLCFETVPLRGAFRVIVKRSLLRSVTHLNNNCWPHIDFFCPWSPPCHVGFKRRTIHILMGRREYADQENWHLRLSRRQMGNFPHSLRYLVIFSQQKRELTSSHERCRFFLHFSLLMPSLNSAECLELVSITGLFYF